MILYLVTGDWFLREGRRGKGERVGLMRFWGFRRGGGWSLYIGEEIDTVVLEK